MIRTAGGRWPRRSIERLPAPFAPRAARCSGSSWRLHPLVERVRVGLGAERSADHESLDLTGALEDRVELRVAVPLLDGEVLDVAPATHRLDRLLARAHRDLGRLELAH